MASPDQKSRLLAKQENRERKLSLIRHKKNMISAMLANEKAFNDLLYRLVKKKKTKEKKHKRR